MSSPTVDYSPNSKNEAEDHPPEFKWGIRHLQALLLFLLIATSACIRTSLNIAVLAMSEKSNNNTDIQIYDWNKEDHGYILASTGLGFTLTQVLAGILMHHYGGKLIITSTVLITAGLMMIIPCSASLGDWIGVSIVLFLQGLCQGFIFPAAHALLGRWAPVNERTRIGMFVYSGLYFGLMITPSITAIIGNTSYGWPWIFYFFGAQTFLICILWMIFGSDSPSNCSRITVEEKILIEKSLNSGSTEKSSKIPWKSIFTSVPFYALLCAQMGGTWGFMTIYNETPSFLSLALKLELNRSGLYTSLGFVNGFLFTIFTSWIVDYLYNKNYLSITHCRKLCNTIGGWSPALIFIGLTFLSHEHQTLMIVALIMVAGVDGISSCGFLVNHIDISPRYAGILMGIVSSITNAVCLLEPLISGILVGDEVSNLDNWKYVFVIAACMYFLGNIIFVLYGSGEMQPWNDYPIEDDKNNCKEVSSIGISDKDPHYIIENSGL